VSRLPGQHPPSTFHTSLTICWPSHGDMEGSLISGVQQQVPTCWWLKTTEVHTVSVQKSGGVQCHHVTGLGFLWGLQEGPSCPFQLLEALSVPWLVAPSPCPFLHFHTASRVHMTSRPSSSYL
jgi:hypothetical protein